MARRNNKIDNKAKGYCEWLLTSPKFRGWVKGIRKHFFIPRNGFDINKLDRLIISDKNPRIPNEIKDKKEFVKSINNILLNFGFSYSWFNFFSDYILFNFVGNIDDKKQIISIDLGHRNYHIREDKKFFELSLQQSPIVILIPPFASQRDIDDFISNNWRDIEELQYGYRKSKFMITKAKRRSGRVKKRNDFIYRNRELPKTELMTLVNEKFGDLLDYTYLNKIIALESKKKSVGI